MDTPPPTTLPIPLRLKPRRRSRLFRCLATLGALSLGAVAVAWFLVHSTSWAGPLLADTLRAVLGPANVARIEDFVYGIEDEVNLAVRSNEAPAPRWEVPVEPAKPKATVAVHEFRPADVGPVNKDHAAVGDGIWVVAREDDFEGPPLLYKTLLHPDPKRSWAEVFVTAIDLERTELHLVSGTLEPRAAQHEGRQWARSQGTIPLSARGQLVAAFNGGFKAEHGHYGMQIGTNRLLPPRSFACTVVRQSSGDLTIGTWTAVEPEANQAAWWRQTPPCMVEGGKLHQQLRDDATTWGAALKGSTVIRRSAIGLSRDRKTLFVAVSNHTTAPAIATAMQHVGATLVAQLDVNWSHTRIVVFDDAPSGPREARGLFEGFVAEPGMYTDEPNTRDFFYVTRQPPAEARP